MLEIHPLTPDRWDDFARLFGPKGACYGCWCTYFRLQPQKRQALGSDDKRSFMQARVENGPAPCLLGYEEGAPVAWVQVGPRADVPEFSNAGRVSAPVDDEARQDLRAWAISCFFIASAARGRGLSHGMVAGAVQFARTAGARVVEACPMRQAKQAKSVGLFVGSERVFEQAGFRIIAERKPGRPLMRLDLS